MHVLSILLLSAPLSVAMPQYGGGGNGPYEGEHKWIPAKDVKGAVRTSCPFLNTAANHGFLPRDGKQISIAQFDKAIVDSLNFDPAFAHAITTTMLGKLGVITNNTEQDAALRVDLDKASKHDFTEHDASVTRVDQSEGNPLPVRANRVQAMLDDSDPKSANFINTKSIGRTRVRVEAASKKAGNPPLSQLFIGASQGEATFILTLMQDDTGPVTAENADARQAPKNRVKAWLNEERFPTELGFKRSSRVITAAENGLLVASVRKWQADTEANNPSDGGPYGLYQEALNAPLDFH